MTKITLPSAVAWLGKMLGLAAIYWATGRLGLLLAVPPGFATAVWPPSGIALAALLLGGRNLWPGIWLGSFLVTVDTSLVGDTIYTMLQSLALAMVIALGGAVQALVGASLVHRYVGPPYTLNRESDIIKFILFGGLLSCLISATIGVSSLCWAQRIAIDDFLFSWWTWWVGDTIGVLTITTIIVIVITTPQRQWLNRQLTVSLPLGVMFAVMVALFFYVNQREVERIQKGFQQQAEAFANAVENRLNFSFEALTAIRSLFYTSVTLQRDEFQLVTGELKKQRPGLQALSWNPRVANDDRDHFEATAHQGGFTHFQIVERDAQRQMQAAARRPEYFPVYYINPEDGNERAIGYDVGSETVRRETIRAAVDSAKLTATPPIMLVQGNDNDPGFLVFLPIYRGGFSPITRDERRARLLGMTVAVYRVKQIVEVMMADMDLKEIWFSIADDSTPPENHLLFTNQSSAAGGNTPLAEIPQTLLTLPHLSKTVNLAGRRWRMTFTATPEYLASHRSLQAWSILAGGLMITNILGALLLITTGQTARIAELVGERTQALSLTNRELQHEIAERKHAETALREGEERLRHALEATSDGLWDWNIPTGQIYYSPQLLRMMGYNPGEVEPHIRTWENAVHPDDLDTTFKSLEAHLLGRADSYQSEHRLRTKTGDWVWNLDRGRIIERDEQGRPVRMIGTHTDISERKRTEGALRQSLQEKEVLLREIHHRVKNNLQVIASLLNLQSDCLEPGNALNQLQESQNRIQTIALIHENLYHTQDLAHINFADYIKSLTSTLLSFYGPASAKVRLAFHVDSVFFSLENAVPCGLILDELIVNCLKHAFPAERTGEIRIQLQQLPQDRVVLIVQDDGVGFPKDLDLEATTTLGLRIVRRLAKQLGGNLEFQRPARGAMVQLSFSLSHSTEHMNKS